VSADLVCLGNLVVDDVVFTDGTTRMGEPGGAMLYAALGAALWELPVAVVAPLGDDYPARALHALEHRGVDLSGLRPLGRPGLRTWLLYEPAGRRIVHRLGAANHIEASPAPGDVAGRFAGSRAFHLSPAPLECQRRLVEELHRREGVLLSLDPHDVVREESLEAWRGVLARVDVFFVSEEELRLPGLRDDPVGTLARLAGGRLRHVLVKRGAAGGVLYDTQTHELTGWSPRVTTLTDPTGAGDAFAGGFLAARLAGESVAGALERAVVSASFALETWGAAGLITATPAEARRRRAEWFGTEAGA
jgi:cytidine kinase